VHGHHHICAPSARRTRKCGSGLIVRQKRIEIFGIQVMSITCASKFAQL